MANRHLTWPGAVTAICQELEEYAVLRDAGRSVAATALAMGIERETAAQYERTLSVLLAALKNETAPAATDAADDAEERTTTS